SGLTVPTGPNDTAHQISVDTGGGTNNRVVILGAGSSVTQSSFNWVHFIGNGTADYTIRKKNTQNDILNSQDETLNDDQDIVVPGRDIKLEAGTINIVGHTLDTGAATQAGNITLTGKHIKIDGGALLNANATTQNGTPGTISINAVDDHAKITAAGFAQVSIN